MSQNIGQANNNDANFRYKMDPLVLKDEGRGNGVKTVITNIVDVAYQLKVPQEYITKYYSYELGTRTEFKASIGTVVWGRHSHQALTKVLHDFIHLLVVCPSCPTPCEMKFETHHKKEESLTRYCKACGDNRRLNMGVRIHQFIYKHLAAASSSSVSGKKKERKGKKAPKDEIATDVADDQPTEIKDAMSETTSADSSPDAVAASDDGNVDTAKKKKAKPAKTVSSSSSSSSVPLEVTADASSSKKKKPKSVTDKQASEITEQDDLITGDTSEEAMAQRREAEINEFKRQETNKTSVSKKPTAKAENAVDFVRLFLDHQPPREPFELVSEVRRLQLTRTFDHIEKLKIVLDALVPISSNDNSKTIARQFETQLKYITPFVNDAGVGEKGLLNALEMFVGETHPDLSTKFPLLLSQVFQVFYNDDVITSDSIFAWHVNPEESWVTVKGRPLKLRSDANPFIAALRKLEED